METNQPTPVENKKRVQLREVLSTMKLNVVCGECGKDKKLYDTIDRHLIVE